MVDIIDEANDKVSAETINLIAQANKDAAKIPRGYPGECLHCGTHSVRLVMGACAPCRDEFGL